MNNSERRQLEQQIRARIEKLQTLLTDVAQQAEDGKRQQDDPSAKLNNTISQVVDSQITANEKQELIRLKNNLQWLFEEGAGYCNRCGEQIPFARLQAVPITRHCINCAQ